MKTPRVVFHEIHYIKTGPASFYAHKRIMHLFITHLSGVDCTLYMSKPIHSNTRSQCKEHNRCDIVSYKGELDALHRHFRKTNRIWESSEIIKKTKTRLYETMIQLMLLHVSDCSTVQKQDEKRIPIAKISWLWKMAGITATLNLFSTFTQPLDK